MSSGAAVTSLAREKRRTRISARATVLAVVLLVLMLFAISPARELLDQRSQLADIERQAQQLARENAELEARIDQLNDPAYLERLARECLGMVKPGETAFVLVPRDGAPARPDC